MVRRNGIGMVVANGGPNLALAMEPETQLLVGNAKKLGMSRADLIAQVERIWEET